MAEELFRRGAADLLALDPNPARVTAT